MCPINRPSSDAQCSAVTELHLQGHSGLCHPPSQTDGNTGRQQPPRPQHIMEAMYIKPWEEDGVLLKAEGQEKSGEPEEGATEASKVSFADAFGLNLVSVKEFNNAEETESDVSLPPEREATLPLEEFYMSCLFTVPSSPEELDQRLQAQMVELESIELLPGTTTIRGIVRVVNLCFSKSVYARMSLDRWASFFDLLAEYVPGSSDRKTDRFAFKYTLIPPFEREGTRLDISVSLFSNRDPVTEDNPQTLLRGVSCRNYFLVHLLHLVDIYCSSHLHLHL
uniref:CBM21 domain-containing protein n=1 Tax=Sparus aurata TaxID=8175 RepID=A0A671YFR7_SPAAU